MCCVKDTQEYCMLRIPAKGSRRNGRLKLLLIRDSGLLHIQARVAISVHPDSQRDPDCVLFVWLDNLHYKSMEHMCRLPL